MVMHSGTEVLTWGANGRVRARNYPLCESLPTGPENLAIAPVPRRSAPLAS